MVTPEYSDSLSSPFGSASWRTETTRKRIIRAHEHFLIKGENVLPKEYEEFQNFIDGIKRRELKEIILREKEH